MSSQAENPRGHENEPELLDGGSSESSTADSEASPDGGESLSIEKLQTEVQARDEKIKTLEAKISEFDRKFIEARAYVKKLESEVEQIRLRTERDAQKNIDQKVSDIASKLLPIVDSFELSLRAAKQSKSDFESFVKGNEMILVQIEEAFRSIGLERICTIDEKFDPSIHEALMNEIVDSADRDGVVIQELKAGYRLGAHVVRPAQVSVGQFNE